MDIYLDNAATTRPFAGLGKLVEQYMREGWHNPSAMYDRAVEVERMVGAARRTLAQPLGAAGANVFFTSGGTESANMVVFCGWRPQGGKPLHFITTTYEHPCVYECFARLAAEGHAVDFVSPAADGHVHAEQLTPLLRENTALVSVMHVNNETGAVNDVAALAAAVKRANPRALFHADGVQGYCKCPLRFDASAVDYYTVSAHKLHGLKGTGAVFATKGTPLRALLAGGGQEQGLRSGTENTLGILAFAAAVEEYTHNHAAKLAHMFALRARLLEKLSGAPGLSVLSPESDFAPHILNLSFEGMRGEVLLHLLEKQGVYISTGSACSSKKGRQSRVHAHLSLTRTQQEGAVRISLCPENTEQEIDIAAACILQAVAQFGRFTRR